MDTVVQHEDTVAMSDVMMSEMGEEDVGHVQDDTMSIPDIPGVLNSAAWETEAVAEALDASTAVLDEDDEAVSLSSFRTLTLSSDMELASLISVGPEREVEYADANEEDEDDSAPEESSSRRRNKKGTCVMCGKAGAFRVVMGDTTDKNGTGDEQIVCAQHAPLKKVVFSEPLGRLCDRCRVRRAAYLSTLEDGSESQLCAVCLEHAPKRLLSSAELVLFLERRMQREKELEALRNSSSAEDSGNGNVPSRSKHFRKQMSRIRGGVRSLAPKTPDTQGSSNAAANTANQVQRQNKVTKQESVVKHEEAGAGIGKGGGRKPGKRRLLSPRRSMSSTSSGSIMGVTAAEGRRRSGTAVDSGINHMREKSNTGVASQTRMTRASASAAEEARRKGSADTTGKRSIWRKLFGKKPKAKVSIRPICDADTDMFESAVLMEANELLSEAESGALEEALRDTEKAAADRGDGEANNIHYANAGELLVLMEGHEGRIGRNRGHVAETNLVDLNDENEGVGEGGGTVASTDHLPCTTKEERAIHDAATPLHEGDADKHSGNNLANQHTDAALREVLKQQRALDNATARVPSSEHRDPDSEGAHGAIHAPLLRTRSRSGSEYDAVASPLRTALRQRQESEYDIAIVSEECRDNDLT